MQSSGIITFPPQFLHRENLGTCGLWRKEVVFEPSPGFEGGLTTDTGPLLKALLIKFDSYDDFNTYNYHIIQYNTYNTYNTY